MTVRNTTLRGLVSVLAALGMVAVTVVLPQPVEAEPESVAADLPAAGVVGTSPRAPGVTVDEALLDELVTAAGAPTEASAPAIVVAHDAAGLDEVEATGVTGTRLQTLPMIIVEDLSGQQLAELRERSGVRSVWGEHENELHMQESVWTTGAREVWEREDLGYTGAGVELAVVDTGADGTHFDFDNLIEFCNASFTGTIGTVPCTTDPEVAHDDNGHGTHVAGTMAGTGAASGGMDDPHSTIGMAPEASIRSYAANVAASLLNTDIVAAYDDLITKKLAGDIEVVAINNSFGGGAGSDYDPDAPQAIAYKAANESGMLPVFSAGNAGPSDNTLGVQCLSPYVLCVGASTKPGGVTAFSSVGRPAAPHPDADENGEEELFYDNHDRRLARAFDIGVYRVGIVAPGAVINAMSANAPGCRMGTVAPTGCYEELQGTSMSAPHVTGAAALVTEAFREAHGRTPSADELLDILERSATPLPGHSAEQQGAGQLDLPAAIEVARDYVGDGVSEPNWIPVGTPHPLYAENGHPGGDTLVVEQLGCTGAGSFSVPAEGGITTFDVPEGGGELAVTVDWDDHHPEANLYLQLFRPGHDPTAVEDDPGPTRTFPVAESAGLLHFDPIIVVPVVGGLGTPATSRTVTFAQPEAGEWSLRVLHRTGGTAQFCGDHDNTEDTQRTEGFLYDVEVHTTRIVDVPATEFDAQRLDPDTVQLDGTATYPDVLEGVTTWQAPGSLVEPPEIEIAEVLYFDGDESDLIDMEGDIVPDAPTDEEPAMQIVGSSLANDDFPYNPLAITWTGEFSGEIHGNLHFDWWWQSTNLDAQLIGVAAHVTVFADPDPDEGEQPDRVVAREEVRFNVAPTPVLNQNTVHVSGTFEETMQIQVSPVFVNTGPGLTAVYGSVERRSQFGIPEPLERFADAGAPDNVRVTDRQDSLRVAWDPADDADGYEVHRSTDPAFEITDDTRIATTDGDACVSPHNPTWDAVDRDGLCYADTDVDQDTTYYYRVISLEGTERGEPSLVAYGTPTFPERQALARVDRIFGPGYWEDADTDGPEALTWTHLWDQRGVDDPDAPQARVFSQGVGSFVTEEPAPDPFADALTLSPDESVNDVGDTHQVTATVTVPGGAPSEGAEVRFEVTGAHETSGDDTTGPDGQATFSYTGATTGEDAITACTNPDGSLPDSCDDEGVLVDDAFKIWIDDDLEVDDLTLEPQESTNDVGDTHQLVATATDADGAPVAGAQVRFEVTGAHAESATRITNSQGEATFSYTGTEAGDDDITACTNPDGSAPASCDDEGTVSDTATKHWVAEAEDPRVDDVTLEPQEATNDVGDTHDVTATTTDQNGDLFQGATVRFEVTGANAGSGTGVTDEDGRVAFSYEGETAGEDTITACTNPDGSLPDSCDDEGTVTDTATKTWVDDDEPDPDPDEVTVERFPGTNRAETACMLAEDTYGQGGFDTVLLARWDDYPDSLAGNYLAGQLDVPVLFTHTTHVTSRTQECLDDNEPDHVILLGGSAAISDAVEADLVGQGLEVERVAGADRYVTAARIATCDDPDRGWSIACTVGEHDGTSGPTGILTSGENFPDALVASAVGYDREFPVLLTRRDSLPEATRDAINELQLTYLLVPGGSAAVAAEVEAEIIATTTVTEVRRFPGARRTETATMVADWAIEHYGWSADHVNLTRSDPPDGFADALVAGPHAGGERHPILLAWSPTQLDVTDAEGDDRRHTEIWLRDNACAVSSIHVAGGTAAVSGAVVDRARTAAEACVE